MRHAHLKDCGHNALPKGGENILHITLLAPLLCRLKLALYVVRPPRLESLASITAFLPFPNARPGQAMSLEELGPNVMEQSAMGLDLERRGASRASDAISVPVGVHHPAACIAETASTRQERRQRPIADGMLPCPVL